VDVQLGRLFDHLRSQGLFDRTVIAVTADHGESLGEHGEDTHGLFVYDSTLHVPLIVRAQGRVKPGTRFGGLVSGVDVAPTLLELVGASPLPGAQGLSFAAALTGGTANEREPVYAESLYGERAYGWAPLHAIRSSREKFVDAPEQELYDLASDPGEKTNLASRRSDAVNTWHTKLASAESGMGSSDPSAMASMTAEQRERIAALGYVSGGAPGTSRRDRPDPKRLVAVSNLFLKAQQEVGSGHGDAAVKLLRQALAKDPANPAVTSLLGSLQYTSKDRGAALAQLRAAAKASPSTFEYQWNLANALFLEKKYDEAAAAYKAAIAIRPQSADAHYALANVLAAKGDNAGAVDEYNAAVKRGLRSAPLLAALGTTLLAVGDANGAEASLRAAVDADPKLADGWNQLGILLDKTNRRAEARSAFTKALEAQPDHADALFNRAKLEVLTKDLPAARKDLDQLLAQHPDYAAAEFLQAHLCVAEGNDAGAKTALERFLGMPGIDARMKAAAEDMLAKL
jgi:tetratricopeptide (TPR) repeat protein